MEGKKEEREGKERLGKRKEGEESAGEESWSGKIGGRKEKKGNKRGSKKDKW